MGAPEVHGVKLPAPVAGRCRTTPQGHKAHSPGNAIAGLQAFQPKNSITGLQANHDKRKQLLNQ
jgi:hypothetical protein